MFICSHAFHNPYSSFVCVCVCVCAFLSSLAVLLQASGCFSNENNCAKGAGEFIAIKDALVAVLGAEPRQSQYLMQISFNQPSVSSYRSTSSRFSCLFFFLPQLDRIVKRNSPLPIMFVWKRGEVALQE